MNLPVIKHPTYKISLSSTNKIIEIRPFTVKEEKILLLAKNSKSETEIISAIKQIINNCVVSPGFDLDKLPMFDLEYLFIQLRGVSVDNILNLTYTDEKTNKVYPFEVDIQNVVIKNYKKGSNKVDIGGGVGVVLEYPSINHLEDLKNMNEKEDDIVELLVKFMKSVYDENNVYERDTDFNKKDIVEFVENLESKSALAIANFFNSLPYLSYTLEIELDNGEKKEIEIKGLQNFFT